MTRHLPQIERSLIRAGIRFSLAMSIADALGYWIFRNGAIVLFCSFAVVSLAYFCDFDGSPRERLTANAVATMVGLSGVVLGAVVAQVFPVAVVLTFVVGFCFTFARVFHGFIARSAVGVQLAYILAVVIPAQRSDLGRYVASWLLGCVVTTVVLMVVLPRHHSGRVRAALSAWCRSAQVLTEAAVRGSGIGVALEGVNTAMEALGDLELGIQEWPGSFSPSQRALSYLFVTAKSATASVRRFADSDQNPDEHAALLGQVSTAAFGFAADELDSVAHESHLVDGIDEARARDLAETQGWVSTTLRTDPDEVVGALSRHHRIRVLSIVADAVQRLALMAHSKGISRPGLRMAGDKRPITTIRSNLTTRSIWFRNGVRAGLGTAIAIVVEHHLGLAHGFWVVLATVALINVTFTGDGAEDFALKASIGTALGVAFGALFLTFHPSIVIFIVVLPFAAFAAKAATGAGTLWGQGTLSFFLIVSTSLLGWPPSIRTAEVRLTDVALGLALAILATLVVFPRGLHKFLDRSSTDAISSVDQMILAGVALFTAPHPDPAEFTARRASCLDQVQRFGEAMDAVFHATSTKSPELIGYTNDEAWMRQGLVVADVYESLLSQQPADEFDPELARVFSLPPADRMGAFEDLAEAQALRLAEAPRAFICSVWAALWTDHLMVDRPVVPGADS